MVTLGLVAGIASNVVLLYYVYVACKRSGENHKRALDAERALRIKHDLQLMHEKRAEMYRAFLIERECCVRHRGMRINTFGGAE